MSEPDHPIMPLQDDRTELRRFILVCSIFVMLCLALKPLTWFAPRAEYDEQIYMTVARNLVSTAITDPRSRATLRRLYAHPRTGALVTMESRARTFPKGLATFIDLRDQRCRTPYCNAPIRHHDHAQPWARGGPTTATNSLGTCERCNYTKDNPGWHVTTNTDENHTHTAHYTTPTGHTYQSTAPPQAPTIDVSELETRIGITLTQRHAA